MGKGLYTFLTAFLILVGISAVQFYSVGEPDQTFLEFVFAQGLPNSAYKAYGAFGLEKEDVGALCEGTATSLRPDAAEAEATVNMMVTSGFLIGLFMLFAVFELEDLSPSRVAFRMGERLSDSLKVGMQVADQFDYPKNVLSELDITDNVKALVSSVGAKTAAAKDALGGLKGKKKSLDKQIEKRSNIPEGAAGMFGTTPKSASALETERKGVERGIKWHKRSLADGRNLLRDQVRELMNLSSLVGQDKLPSEWKSMAPAAVAMAQRAIYNGMMIPMVVDHAIYVALIMMLILAIAIAIFSAVLSGWSSWWNPCLEYIYMKPFLIIGIGYWVYLLVKNLVVDGANGLRVLLPGWLTGIILFLLQPSGEGVKGGAGGGIQALLKVGFVMFVVTSGMGLMSEPVMTLFIYQVAIAGLVVIELFINIILSKGAFNTLQMIFAGEEGVTGWVRVFMDTREYLKDMFSAMGEALRGGWSTFTTDLSKARTSLADKRWNPIKGIQNWRKSRKAGKLFGKTTEKYAKWASQKRLQGTVESRNLMSNLVSKGVSENVAEKAFGMEGGLEAIGKFLAGPGTENKGKNILDIKPQGGGKGFTISHKGKAVDAVGFEHEVTKSANISLKEE